MFEGETFTYKDLDDRSLKVAHYLRGIGIGSESLVGICIDRSFEMIIGIVGILRCGAAYVPIDPDYPLDRIGYMLEDTSASVVLTGSRSKSSLPAGFKGRLVVLDEDWDKIAEMPLTSLELDIDPHHLAYVIYTSGRR